MSGTKMLFGYNFGKLSVAIIPTYQDKADREDWVEINPDTLADDLALAYQEYKESYRQTKALRLAFETAMKATAGVTVPPKAKPASRKAVSLSDYLSAREHI